MRIVESRLDRQIRALSLVLLLTGSLLPDVGGVNLVLPAAIVVVIVLIADCLRSLPTFHPALRLVLVIFTVLGAYALLKHPDTAYGQEKFMRLMTLTVLSAGAATLIRGRDSLVVFCKAWLMMACLLSAAALFSGAQIADRAIAFEGDNAIGVGRVLASAAIGIVWLRWERVIGRALTASGFCLLMAGLWATGSRGPMVAAGVGVALLAFRSRAARATRVGLILTAGVVTLGFIAYVAPQSRLASLLFSRGQDLTVGIREMLWTRAWGVIVEHPGGVGYGEYMSAAGVAPVPYPHNLFLEVTAELGWLIGGLLLFVVIGILRGLFRRAGRDGSAGLVLALFAAEVAEVSVSGDMTARPFFFFLTLGYVVMKSDVLRGTLLVTAVPGAPTSPGSGLDLASGAGARS